MHSSLLIRSWLECDHINRGRPYRKRHAKSSRCSSCYQDWRRRATRHHDSVIQRECVCGYPSLLRHQACQAARRSPQPPRLCPFRGCGGRRGDMGSRAERVRAAVGTRCCCRPVGGIPVPALMEGVLRSPYSRDWCRGEDGCSAYSGRRLTLVFKSIRVPPLKLSSCVAIPRVFLYLTLSQCLLSKITIILP